MARLRWRYVRHTKYIPGHWKCLNGPYSIWRYQQYLFLLRAADGTGRDQQTHKTLFGAKRLAQTTEDHFSENNS